MVILNVGVGVVVATLFTEIKNKCIFLKVVPLPVLIPEKVSDIVDSEVGCIPAVAVGVGVDTSFDVITKTIS